MKKYFTVITLIACLFVGGFLRSINFTGNPVSLSIDEVSFGYSAYSILKTGRDEYGVFMPLTFQSTGDYKNPVPIYLMVLPVMLFGLNEFSVRLPNVLIGTLGIIIFYLLFQRLLNDRKIALVGTFLASISAWHIYFSRYAYDGLVAITLVCIGTIFLLKIFQGKIINSFFAAFFLILSMYTYYTERIFVPLLVLAFLALNFSQVRKHFRSVVIFVGLCFLFTLPLLLTTIFGADSARLKMVFIGNDIEYTRNVLVNHLYPQLQMNSGMQFLNPLTYLSHESLLLPIFWAQRYINYFDSGFFFFSGLNMTQTGTMGLGILYLFELPLLIIGVIEVLKKKFINGYFLLVWVAIGFFPASITNNEFNAGRALVAIPGLLALSAIGAVRSWNLLISLKSRLLKISILTLSAAFSLVILLHAFIVFKVHYPYTRGEDFMEGTRESLLYALQNQADYDEIVVDPMRGVQAGDVFNIPDMYLVFYSQHNPSDFQRVRTTSDGIDMKIGKFTIRKIYWPEDQNKQKTLFIGSPWSLKLEDVKESEILKKVYLTNGALALLIVAPKPEE